MLAHAYYPGFEPMSFYVIDDHPLMREAMAMLLRRLNGGADVVELSHLGQLDEAVRKRGEPQLFCLDLKLPDTAGVSGVQAIRQRFADTPLVVLSASPPAEHEQQCLDAGADIYLDKAAGVAEISAALTALLNPDHPTSIAGDHAFALSNRQRQLLAMLEQGLSNRDIALKLEISEHTVKVHLWRLFKRLGVSSRTQAVHHARANGLLGH